MVFSQMAAGTATAAAGTKLPLHRLGGSYNIGFVKTAATAFRHASKNGNTPPTILQSFSVTTIGSLRGGGGSASVVDASAYSLCLLLATFFCSAVFGMMLFVALALMPGLAGLSDGDYLQAFQGVDGIFQEGRPAVLLFWFGAVLSLVQTTVMSFRVDGISTRDQQLLITATVLHLLGQIMTFAVNIPRNNRVQRLHNVSKLSKATQSAERLYFERPWIKANWVRTAAFGSTSLCLLWTLLLQSHS